MYSEPKDAGATERVKYVTTILVSFMINQGCISFFGEIKNKTKQKGPQILKKLEASKETEGKQRLQTHGGEEEAVSCTLDPFDRGNC